MKTKPIEIALELEPDGDTLSGRASRNGTVREFSGRIGLMALVDSMVDEARKDDETDLTKDGENPC